MRDLQEWCSVLVSHPVVDPPTPTGRSVPLVGDWRFDVAPLQGAAEAYLSDVFLALPMARFPEAERRRLHKMICMQCYARNAMRATRCRKCGSRELRPKAKEARKE